MMLIGVSARDAAAQGSVVTSSSTSVTLNRGADTITLPLMKVRRIEVRDSLINGTLIGALIGGGVSAWIAVTLDRDCNGPCGNWGAITRFIAVGAGAGALAGMGIDALHRGRRGIDRSPRPSRSVAILPTFSDTHLAVRVTARW